uniref:BPI1 domain-containing protein n=1 Tax=Bursaphelenchus xylophilus TaxID=6326 RepID=A0A1I7S166_BURXY
MSQQRNTVAINRSLWLLLFSAILVHADSRNSNVPQAKSPPLPAPKIQTIDGHSETSAKAMHHLMQHQERMKLQTLNKQTAVVNNGQTGKKAPIKNSNQLNQKGASEGLPASFRQATQPSGKDKSATGSKAHGYQTQQYASTGGCAGGQCANGVNGAYGGQGYSSVDYNPLLAGGVRGGPGIKARINSRGFQYASALIAPILDQAIRKARIPPITQRIAEVNGCIQVYNLYVSRYRCPQRVVLYPAPPNQIVLAVQNLDVGVTGNLAGTANILIPIPISGIIEVNAHQVSITVALVVDRAASGGISLRVASCQAYIGYLDAYIVNGGLIGDLANGMFRGRISSQIQQMLPGELCNRLPGILDSEVNSKLGAIPQSISLTQILNAAGGALGIQNLLAGAASGGQCPSTCGGAPAQVPTPVVAPPVPVGPAPAPLPPVGAALPYQAGPVARPVAGPVGLPVGAALPYNVGPAARAAPKAQSIPIPTDHGHNGDNLATLNSRKVQRYHVAGVSAVQQARPLPRPEGFDARGRRIARAAAPKATIPVVVESRNKTKAKAFGSGSVQFGGAGGAGDVCSGCPSSGGGSQLGFLSTLVQSLDLNKLSTLAITTQLLQSYATSNDYTIEINGEFSPNGQGGTPFGPFPMYFPYSPGRKMAEVLVSDYTINSLFYWLHRTGFLTFRIGPETPKIGELLRTTCADADETLEDHGGRISGSAQITRLQLNDYEGTLGLPQDALDNLGSLGKEVIQKAANDALQNGIALNIPSGIGGLPINFVQPEFHILEHALHIESDFTVDPAGLQGLLGGGGGGFGGACRR